MVAEHGQPGLYEAAVITDNIRFAEAHFDDARKAAVEDAVARLPKERSRPPF